MESRYNRQVQLPGFGEAAQQKLQQARVLVVGAGGLGVPVLQYLTGMGVGIIGMIDGDSISLTNLHRQVLYTERDVGQLKVRVAAKKLAELNSSVHLQPYPTVLTPENALDLIQCYDLVIDATDNFEARYLINDACVILGKPFVYGALYQFEGQVSVFNAHGGPTYRCLYPTPPSAKEIPDCNTAGVLGVVPGLIGCQQALEAVKVITGLGESLSGQLLLLDCLHLHHRKIKLKANPENQNIQSLQASYQAVSCTLVPEIAVQQVCEWLSSGKRFLLLDVREPDEFSRGHLQKALLTPLSKFYSQIEQVPLHLPIVLVCQQGTRSRRAAELLLDKQKDLEVYSMTGGMGAWKTELHHHFIVT